MADIRAVRTRRDTASVIPLHLSGIESLSDKENTVRQIAILPGSYSSSHIATSFVL